MRIDLQEIQRIDAIEDRDTKVMEAAMYYAKQGIPVIPIPYGEKKVNSKTLYTSRCSSRTSKIREWFDPEMGSFKGWNIAVGCGDYFGKGGVFAIDVDNKYSKNYGDAPWGPAAWDEIESQHGPLDGPLQRTPSGGCHIVTAWQDNLTPSQNRLAPGIDTRGGHKGKISSHIMVWPSEVDGKRYEWERGGDVAEPPKWLTDKMGESWGGTGRPKTSGETGRGNEEMGDDDIERQVSLPRVKAYLASLNPDNLDYNDWLRVGQAIHSQHQGEDALEVWDEWSQRGERYEPGECVVRWRGFSSNGPIRMATLEYIVQEFGDVAKVEPDQGGDEENFVLDAIDEYNRSHAVVLTGEQTKVLRKEGVPNSIQFQYKFYSVDAYRVFKCNDFQIIQTEEGPKKIKKFDIWVSSPNRRSFDGMMMRPDMGPVIRVPATDHRYLNTWAGFAVNAVEGDWSLLKDHILENLCCGNEYHYEWLMDWMADMFQEPSDPKGCAVILGGVEGSGKGTLANALAHLFGIHATIVSNNKHLKSQFNAMLMDSVFIFADEVVYAGNHEVANMLKAMVTEKTNIREQKFGAMEKVTSYIHLMMSTNNEWKVAAGPESRRYFVLQVRPDVANSVPYFGAIREQLRNGGYEAMLHELLHRQITHNLRFAPVTEELLAQRTLMQVHSINDSLPAWVSYILNYEDLGVMDIKAGMDDSSRWPSVVSKKDLWDAYAAWAREHKSKAGAVSDSVFHKRMKEIGFEEGPRIKVGKHDRLKTIKVPPYDQACKLAQTVMAIQVDNQEEETE